MDYLTKGLLKVASVALYAACSINLALVQKAMNHSDIKTTLRYAHVLDSEVAEALERVQKSRKKSRKLKIVG